MKKISLDDSVYTIVNENSEIKDILVGLGLTQINDKKMFNTVARVMTVRKAARLHNLDYNALKKAFNTYGFDLLEEEL